MKRKNRPKKRPAVHPRLEEAQERRVVALISKAQTSTPSDVVKRVQDSLSAQRLIELLPTEEHVIPLLLALRERFHEKNVNRAIRRAVFKLDRKGIATDAFLSDDALTSTILKPPEKRRPLCYVGPVNGTGTRAVILILHRGGKGVDTGFGMVSDMEGFQEFFFRTVSRKDAKKLREQFAKEAGPFVETSLAHAATILETAYQCQQRANTTPPADYLELRPWLLETTSLLERPAIYDLIPESMLSDQALTDSNIKTLFENPLMETWLIEPDALKPFMEEMFKVNESPIVLTEDQKAARIREIQEKCMGEIFTVEERERLQHRLEEMGHIFFKLGQEDDAGVALAAARSVVQETSILKADPVVETLLARSLAIYGKAMKESGGESIRETASASPIIMS